ncbi:hypothetical protein Hsero_0192 [Herbaspirillum seropedicae SmR1]|uniref:Uncharacterized protein n=1 Tax=Herbaspirillum seropedicae (strain SmR1) TaxID=757424 RepID=D8IUZ9_HERSS|nr:hypothetical protein Hsero_0192 [Herbaspirillum seropedicae SmR1]
MGWRSRQPELDSSAFVVALVGGATVLAPVAAAEFPEATFPGEQGQALALGHLVCQRRGGWRCGYRGCGHAGGLGALGLGAGLGQLLLGLAAALFAQSLGCILTAMTGLGRGALLRQQACFFFGFFLQQGDGVRTGSLGHGSRYGAVQRLRRRGGAGAGRCGSGLVQGRQLRHHGLEPALRPLLAHPQGRGNDGQGQQRHPPSPALGWLRSRRGRLCSLQAARLPGRRCGRRAGGLGLASFGRRLSGGHDSGRNGRRSHGGGGDMGGADGQFFLGLRRQRRAAGGRGGLPRSVLVGMRVRGGVGMACPALVAIFPCAFQNLHGIPLCCVTDHRPGARFPADVPLLSWPGLRARMSSRYGPAGSRLPVFSGRTAILLPNF